jgi:hypothetical protein
MPQDAAHNQNNAIAIGALIYVNAQRPPKKEASLAMLAALRWGQRNS